MILENKKNIRKKVKLLYKINALEEEYLVYEDEETMNIYAGLYQNRELHKIDDRAIFLIEELINRIEGSEEK